MSTLEYKGDQNKVKVRIFYLFPFVFAPWTTNTTLQHPGYNFGYLQIKNEDKTNCQFIILEREISSQLLEKFKDKPKDVEIYLR